MSTAAKKNKTFDEIFDEGIEIAERADAKDVKVPISLRLDSDIYNELNRRAEAGEANGKYQTLLNEILREALFAESTNQLTVQELDALRQDDIAILRDLIKEQRRGNVLTRFKGRQLDEKEIIKREVAAQIKREFALQQKAVSKATKMRGLK
jgi:uncharacterized protein (DUF4415 family)